jgi:pimeloyl-ACP methyl ester carboxylesterase
MTKPFATVAPIDDIDARLADAESAFADIRPGLAKEIVWADPLAKTRAALAVVYIHGFSASKGEVRPLPDLVAKALGANLFYTRLAGHGRSADAMAEASVDAWKNDMEEALDIATHIGERTLIIATSTGAALATWALAQPGLTGPVAGAVFLAPNYKIRRRGAGLLTAPFARVSARLLLGKRRGFVPLSALHAAYWMTDYPVSALLPMADLIKEIRGLPFEKIGTPALFIQSAKDQVVDPLQTARVARRWGGPATLVDPGDVGDPYGHVVAGDALSPKTTEAIAKDIRKWFINIQ